MALWSLSAASECWRYVFPGFTRSSTSPAISAESPAPIDSVLNFTFVMSSLLLSSEGQC